MKRIRNNLIIVNLSLLILFSCSDNKNPLDSAGQSFKERDYAASVDILNKEETKKRLNFDEAYLRGMSYYKLLQYNKALPDFKSCNSLKQGNKIILLKLGECYLAMDMIDSAKGYFSYVVKLQPNDWQALNYRGLCYLRQKKTDSATNDLNKSIGIYPNYLAYNNLGQVNEFIKKFSAAITYYNLSLRLNHSDDKVFFNKGVSLMYLDRPDSALFNYNKAIALEGNNPVYYLNRGMASYLLKHRDSACKDWEKASNMGNGDADSFLLKYCH